MNFHFKNIVKNKKKPLNLQQQKTKTKNKKKIKNEIIIKKKYNRCNKIKIWQFMKFKKMMNHKKIKLNFNFNKNQN